MADFYYDQAAGLRRLFAGPPLQVITFVAGCEGVGRSVTVANLGVAVARLGREVMIIDENSSRDDIASAFGLMPRFDLLDLLEGRASLAEVILQPMHGLRVLPAARAASKLGCLSAPQRQALLESMAGLTPAMDLILVDASMAHPQGFSPFGLVSQDTVVVLSGSSASITEAYAMIKKVSHAYARRHFRILVNKVRSLHEGRMIYDNIARVCAQRGVAQLEFAGAVVLDDALRQASQLGRPLLAHAPGSPAAAAIRDVAADLPCWIHGAGEGAGLEQFVQQLLHLSQRITPNLLRA